MTRTQKVQIPKRKSGVNARRKHKLDQQIKAPVKHPQQDGIQPANTHPTELTTGVPEQWATTANSFEVMERDDRLEIFIGNAAEDFELVDRLNKLEKCEEKICKYVEVEKRLEKLENMAEKKNDMIEMAKRIDNLEKLAENKGSANTANSQVNPRQSKDQPAANMSKLGAPEQPAPVVRRRVGHTSVFELAEEPSEQGDQGKYLSCIL